ncbi:MCE family protein [Mycobacterium sp. M1]|uniref:MCE family protein n=1 Tax=Mycolicibacter acidiphilus TaxID=2835306 RepID=A0ABS5RNB3_9MYCO|nr:MCE family protein [Mycolicibacter acidiphilus]MBS9535706.1 MCE family protein [Mycolicibacter acidiphilus]
MSIKGTALKLAAIGLVLALFTVGLVVVFGQVRFDRTFRYTAEFTNGSGLRQGQFVRASGVEVGKVKDIRLIDGGRRVAVDFDVDRSLPLYQSTTAQIRYADLIGNRYLELKRGEGEGADQVLPQGGFIPAARTQPALDLDALIGGFKPVFKALDPDKVNTIATSIVKVFQGQGGTINDILVQTTQLTSSLAERDQAIGEVVKNLNAVLDVTVKHRQEFDATIDNFEKLVSGLNAHKTVLANGTADFGDAAGNLATLLADNRELFHKTFPVAGPEPPDRAEELDQLLQQVPAAVKLVGRTAIYGDFFNFYICDATLKLQGLQPGGPVRQVRIWSQPTGRCTPQ